MIVYLYHGNGGILVCATRERARAELACEFKFLTEGVCGWHVINSDLFGDGSAVMLRPFGAKKDSGAEKLFYFEPKELLP